MVAAVAVGALRDDWDLYHLGGSPLGGASGALLSPLVGVGVGLLLVLSTRLATRYLRIVRRLHNDLRGLLGPLRLRDCLLLAATSAVGEEVLFRGALLPWLGVLPSTALFAVLHIGPRRRFLLWTLWAFAAGLLFAHLALRLGDLGAPIAAHFTVNLLNLRAISREELVE